MKSIIVTFTEKCEMVMTIKKGSNKAEIERVISKVYQKKTKGIDAYKYCGVIKLKEAPNDIQKRLRSEWN